MNGENTELFSFENVPCIVVLEKKERALLRNVVWLVFTNVLCYSDQKESNPHKQFREKNFESVAFRVLSSHSFFLADYA